MYMKTKNTYQKLFSPQSIAIVGASNKKGKIGTIIAENISKLGYKGKTYLINPAYKFLGFRRCYPSLSALPVKPDAVNFVVPPKVGEPIIAECVALGIKNVWLQPGANGENVVTAAKNAELNVIHRSCILVEVRKQDPYL